ncbi:MAG: T9SS type A sorting domain-containing protein [Saprospirales bacterium]|nr:T9SS type A sorting domain-containing protein [Saprospirales bacterium]
MTDIEELQTKYGLRVYPNPANNFIIIDLNTHLNYDAELIIYNSMGNRVIMSLEITVMSGKNLINVDMQNLPSGTYHYRIVGNELDIVGRFAPDKTANNSASSLLRWTI